MTNTMHFYSNLLFLFYKFTLVTGKIVARHQKKIMSDVLYVGPSLITVISDGCILQLSPMCITSYVRTLQPSPLCVIGDARIIQPSPL